MNTLQEDSQVSFNKIPNWVTPYIGIPYKDHGRSNEGFDCYGLVTYVLKNHYAKEIPSYEYQHSEDDASVAKAIYLGKDDWQPIQLGQEQSGDVLVLTVMGYPIHIGVIVAKSYMLHTLRTRNCCIENYLSSAWKRRIEGIYRWTA